MPRHEVDVSRLERRLVSSHVPRVPDRRDVARSGSCMRKVTLLQRITNGDVEGGIVRLTTGEVGDSDIARLVTARST